MTYHMGLYDSDTGETLQPEKAVDVSEWIAGSHRERVQRVTLIYATAKRGRIVQVHRDGMRIHYFFDEAGSQRMIEEDTERHGFVPGELLALIFKHAPEKMLGAGRG